MLARLPSFFLLTPFIAVFLYAAWHEYSRFKRHGASSYGLHHDPTTNSTYVGALKKADDRAATALHGQDQTKQDTRS